MDGSTANLLRRFLQREFGGVRLTSLSLRGPNGAVAISGKHLQFVQSNDKTYQPIASVAALTAQPLAALPPYGCGVPLAGCDRLAGWQCLQRKFIDATPSGLSLRGGRRPTWQSREGSCDFAITYLLSTWVLRDSHVASLLGMTRQAGAAVHQSTSAVEYLCTRRSLSAATDAIGFYRFNGSLYGSFVQRRARLSAPLQRHVRSAIVPPNLQPAWRSLPVKGTPHP